MNIPSKIFIIPYRNRCHEKTHFSVYMKYILEDLDPNEYEIYFSHQCDNRPFNRGGMKNIGFLAMKDKYPNHYKNITFIFNDIDTIPCKKDTLNYDTTQGVVKHFYGFTFALGGIFSITGEDFEKCNGFPGLWGWGIEDNTMQYRVLQNNIKIDRSVFYTIGSSQIIQILDKPYRLIADKDASRRNCNDGLNTIKNLNYNIENEYINVTSFTNSMDPNLEEFYQKDISVPGSHKAIPNILPKLRQMEHHRKLQNKWKLY